MGLTVLSYDAIKHQIDIEVSNNNAEILCDKIKQCLKDAGKEPSDLEKIQAGASRLRLLLTPNDLEDVWALCRHIFQEYQAKHELNLPAQLLQLKTESKTESKIVPASKVTTADKPWFLGDNLGRHPFVHPGFTVRSPGYLVPYSKFTRGWSLMSSEETACLVKIPNENQDLTEIFFKGLLEKLPEYGISEIDIRKLKKSFVSINAGAFILTLETSLFKIIAPELTWYAILSLFDKEIEKADILTKIIADKFLEKFVAQRGNQLFEMDFKQEIIREYKKLLFAPNVEVKKEFQETKKEVAQPLTFILTTSGGYSNDEVNSFKEAALKIMQKSKYSAMDIGQIQNFTMLTGGELYLSFDKSRALQLFRDLSNEIVKISFDVEILGLNEQAIEEAAKILIAYFDKELAKWQSPAFHVFDISDILSSSIAKSMSLVRAEPQLCLY